VIHFTRLFLFLFSLIAEPHFSHAVMANEPEAVQVDKIKGENQWIIDHRSSVCQ
jgi:hypothetical protein